MQGAPRERFVTNRTGDRLYVADWGDPLDPRPAVLGLPGYARNSKDFEHIAERYEAVSKAYETYAPRYEGVDKFDVKAMMARRKPG